MTSFLTGLVKVALLDTEGESDGEWNDGMASYSERSRRESRFSTRPGCDEAGLVDIEPDISVLSVGSSIPRGPPRLLLKAGGKRCELDRSMMYSFRCGRRRLRTRI